MRESRNLGAPFAPKNSGKKSNSKRHLNVHQTKLSKVVVNLDDLEDKDSELKVIVM